MGFGRSAITDDQLEKLKPFVGEVPDTFTSHFMATWQMYLPSPMCEIKCGAATLDIADRQNARSMTPVHTSGQKAQCLVLAFYALGPILSFSI
jgi:hypothetical protein